MSGADSGDRRPLLLTDDEEFTSLLTGDENQSPLLITGDGEYRQFFTEEEDQRSFLTGDEEYTSLLTGDEDQRLLLTDDEECSSVFSGDEDQSPLLTGDADQKLLLATGEASPASVPTIPEDQVSEDYGMGRLRTDYGRRCHGNSYRGDASGAVSKIGDALGNVMSLVTHSLGKWVAKEIVGQSSRHETTGAAQVRGCVLLYEHDRCLMNRAGAC